MQAAGLELPLEDGEELNFFEVVLLRMGEAEFGKISFFFDAILFSIASSDIKLTKLTDQNFVVRGAAAKSKPGSLL